MLVESIQSVSGNLDDITQNAVRRVLSKFQEDVQKKGKERGLYPSQLGVLRPCNTCVIVDIMYLHVVYTNTNVGGIQRFNHQDFRKENTSLTTGNAIYLIQRDLGWQQCSALTLPVGILDETDERLESAILQFVEQYLQQEALNIERSKRVVRLKPLFEGRDFLIEDDLVFVLMPFKPTFNEILQNCIKPIIQDEFKMRCETAKEIFQAGPIMEQIWSYINRAKFIIGDLTEKNPNVFYELGLAHTVGKEVILIAQEIEDVPFDLRHLRVILYENTGRGRETLRQSLRQSVASLVERK